MTSKTLSVFSWFSNSKIFISIEKVNHPKIKFIPKAYQVIEMSLLQKESGEIKPKILQIKTKTYCNIPITVIICNKLFVEILKFMVKFLI